MGDIYLECHKTHKTLDGKIDGCQEFMEVKPGLNCGVCGCHRNFHRKAEVVYKCHRILSNGCVDGCQEFMPERNGSLTCAVCFCNKGYHRYTATTYNEDDLKKNTGVPEDVLPENYDEDINVDDLIDSLRLEEFEM